MKILETFFPVFACLVCRTEINAGQDETPYLCGACDDVLMVHTRVCDKCGRSVGLHAFVCDRCNGKKNKRGVAKDKSKHDWYFTRARSAFSYDGAVVDLILRLKYGAEGDVARFVAPHLASVVRTHKMAADLIVPVPLAPKRARERGYNQAAVLAAELAKLLGTEVLSGILTRTRETAAQKKMTLLERQENLRNAFTVTTPARLAIKGKRILLVDDVITTGATADECARTLKKAGAKSVEVLTVASVASMC